MFSKRLFRLVASLSLGLALTLAGCSANVGESAPKEGNYSFSGAQCLSKMSPVIMNFIDGSAKDEELGGAWDCIGSAVTQFKRYVRGKTADRYTPQEIATFLEENFLDTSKGDKISPELQAQFMKLKTVFLGGSVDYLTLTELDIAVDVFKALRDVTLHLNPYMKIFSLNWSVSSTGNIQKDMTFFEEANTQIQNAAKDIAAIVEKNGQTYVLSDFSDFMIELAKFFKEDWSFNQTIIKYMPVVKKVKKALAGGDENSIAPEEWRRFSLLGGRGYIQYLRYYYFIQSAPQTGTAYRLAYISRTVEDVLSVFQDLVAQKPEGVVSRAEVTDLLLTLSNVWPSFKVSSNLIFEAMKLKQLFFGGSIDSFSTTDFNTARLKVSRLRVLIERFMPYYSIYGQEWDPELYTPDAAQKFFMDSQFILEATGRELGSLFEGAYDLHDLLGLIQEWEVLYPPSDPSNSMSAMVQKFIPLATDLKNIVLGGADSSIKQEQWSPTLGFAARTYSDYLYYGYFLKGLPWNRPDTVGYLSVLSNQTLNILRDVLTAKEENQLSRAELGQIVRRLIDLNLLPDGITADMADKVIRVVVNNILTTPETRLGGGAAPNALTMNSVEVARSELQIWLDSELFFADISQNWKPDQGLVTKDLLAVLQKQSKAVKGTDPLATGLKEFLLSVQSPAPMTVDGQGRLIISSATEQAYTHASLSQLNIDRALSRLMIRSFAGDLNRIKTYAGVTEAEVTTNFNDLRDIFVKMGLIDPTNLTFASSRFRDANIFMPHGNGDNLASYQEITDLVGMIWSGLNINSLLKADLIKSCLNGATNTTDDTLVKVDCVRKTYRTSMAQNMTSVPGFLKYIKKLSTDDYNVLMTNILKAAGYVSNGKGTAKLGDISLTPHVIQYIEMMYVRFDKNKDGSISTADALRAYPAFKNLLLEYAKPQIDSGSLKEEDLPAVFTFMLRYGRPPTSLKEKIIFVLKWRNKPDNWDVDADRTQLSQILGYIADQTSAPSANSEPPEASDPNASPTSDIYSH